MGGYLETKTAEKLQSACDAIKRACQVYEISNLYKLGLMRESEVKHRLKIAGIYFNDSFPEDKAMEVTTKEFIPTRVLAKILQIDNPYLFWYAKEMFTTCGHDGMIKEQCISVDEALCFLHRNGNYSNRVRDYIPQTKEEESVLRILKKGMMLE